MSSFATTALVGTRLVTSRIRTGFDNSISLFLQYFCSFFGFLDDFLRGVSCWYAHSSILYYIGQEMEKTINKKKSFNS